MAVWSRLQSFIFGGAVASAAADGIRPVLEPVRQHAWQQNPLRVLSPEQAAQLVTEGLIPLEEAEAEAAREGIGPNRLEALIQLLYRVPGVAELMRLWRRDLLTDAQWREALQKAGIRPDWIDALAGLKQEPLEPAEIAKAIHRGIMDPAGLLLASPSTVPGRVPIVPPSPLDPTTEAAWSGIDHERLRVLVGNAGLPPGIMEGLTLLNRGEITEDDFTRLVGESNMRNEWATVLLALRRRVLTPHEYASLRLRGWITEQESYDGAALSGMEPADANMLYNDGARPLNVHQVVTALARGGVYDDPLKPDTPGTERAALVAQLEAEGWTLAEAHALVDSVQESNVQPRYYGLALANKYTYPSAFVLRSIAQAGDLTEAETNKVLLEIGWPPAFAKQIAAAWAGGSGASGKAETRAELATEYEGGFITEAEYRQALAQLGYAGTALDLEVELGDARRNARYRERVVDAVAAAYREFEIDEAEATQDLATVGVVGIASQQLVALWQLERRYTRTRLTEAQVVKAYKKGLLAETDALTRLQDFGLSAADAQVRLQEG